MRLKFFTNICSNLSKLITPQCGSICHTLLNTNCSSIFLSEANVDEIIKILRKLTQKASTDCNDMNMSIVKNLVLQLFAYIYRIFHLQLVFSQMQ